METGWIWFWYILIVIVIWLLLTLRSTGNTLSSGVAFVVASIFGLLFGLILIPFYTGDVSELSEGDQTSLTAFVVIAVLLPIFGLIYIAATGEYKHHWNRGMKGMCNGSLYMAKEMHKEEMKPVEYSGSCGKPIDHCGDMGCKSRQTPMYYQKPSMESHQGNKCSPCTKTASPCTTRGHSGGW